MDKVPILLRQGLLMSEFPLLLVNRPPLPKILHSYPQIGLNGTRISEKNVVSPELYKRDMPWEGSRVISKANAVGGLRVRPAVRENG